MKRVFEYKGERYKVRKDRGERLSHKQTDDMLYELLAQNDSTYIAGGDTIIVVSEGTAYIATIRESIDLDTPL
jgi:hypothetical protein